MKTFHMGKKWRMATGKLFYSRGNVHWRTTMKLIPLNEARFLGCVHHFLFKFCVRVFVGNFFLLLSFVLILINLTADLSVNTCNNVHTTSAMNVY